MSPSREHSLLMPKAKAKVRPQDLEELGYTRGFLHTPMEWAQDSHRSNDHRHPLRQLTRAPRGEANNLRKQRQRARRKNGPGKREDLPMGGAGANVLNSPHGPALPNNSQWQRHIQDGNQASMNPPTMEKKLQGASVEAPSPRLRSWLSPGLNAQLLTGL